MPRSGKRPFKPDDLLAFNIISDARISPDGESIAAVMQEAHLETNEYTANIYLVGSYSGVTTRFTSGHHQDSEPRWSPDGETIAFVSDRSGTPQIHLISVHGGEARQLTRLDRGASGIVWSPEGTRIAFLSSEGCGIDDEKRNKPGGMIRHITRRRYRFDVTGYIDGRFPHVWMVEVETGETRQVTSGEQADAMPAWSPDGDRIAFVSNRENEVDLGHTSQLYLIDVPPFDRQHPGERDNARRLDTGAASHAVPAWSPDGAHIAVIGRREGARAGANNDVYLVGPDDSGSTQRLTAEFDRGIGLGNYSDTWDSGMPSLFWTPDGSAIRFSANDKGNVGLFETDLNGSIIPVISGERTAAPFSNSASGERIAFIAGTFTNPCDLYACDGAGNDERRLTAVNADLLAERAVRDPEHLPFESFDGRFEVDAWLIRPTDFDPAQQYPLVQLIHGGPHSVFGHTFFFDMQLWAGQGWNVLFINPRATQGYGEDFATACIGDWGGADWKEQEQALDLAIERGGIDPNRLAVTGLSYGGFMTNWIVGQTNRYRVGVSENSISNLVSFMFTSDIGWGWLEHEMEKELWSNLDWYMEKSPITYVPNISTPVLLLQSETDWRCPVEQGEQFYQALRHKGIDTEMVRFPGESHVALRSGKPESRLSRRQHTLRWFETYL